MLLRNVLFSPSIFVGFHAINDTTESFYRIENQTMAEVLLYRQNNCDGTSWSSLNPGEKTIFVWDEPTYPRQVSHISSVSLVAFKLSQLMCL